MTAIKDRLIDNYLQRLDRAARALPRRDRAELVAEIRSHVASAATVESSEADVRNILEELGAPEDIVEAARPVAVVQRRSRRDSVAVWLLLLGGILVYVGWLVGAYLLVTSRTWTARQKALGILVFPGGYMGVIWVATRFASSASDCHAMTRNVNGTTVSTMCGGSSGYGMVGGFAAFLVLLAVETAVAIYLDRVARRPPRRPLVAAVGNGEDL